ncbi:MAG TPA: hypothetical protein VGS98_02655 [Thermoanaerobaculia bacterium]|nr:hypothetical protein [Thermoanaerobaculia bacterium]
MAPDRRFGLPHPLDADPSEDSSPRKPGLWESFKRALGSAPPEASTSGEPASPAAPGPPLPAAPLSATPTRSEETRVAPDPADDRMPADAAAAPLHPDELAFDVPFLEDLPPEPLAPPVPPQSPAEASKPHEPPTAASPADSSESPAPPPLARGLASFSRDNALREKKFAHLLRDQPGGESKRPGPPRRRR